MKHTLSIFNILTFGTNKVSVDKKISQNTKFHIDFLDHSSNKKLFFSGNHFIIFVSFVEFIIIAHKFGGKCYLVYLCCVKRTD